MMSTATPPTTPPAIAPTGVLELEDPPVFAAAEADEAALEEAGTVVTEKTVEREGGADVTEEDVDRVEELVGVDEVVGVVLVEVDVLVCGEAEESTPRASEQG